MSVLCVKKICHNSQHCRTVILLLEFSGKEYGSHFLTGCRNSAVVSVPSERSNRQPPGSPGPNDLFSFGDNDERMFHRGQRQGISKQCDRPAHSLTKLWTD